MKKSALIVLTLFAITLFPNTSLLAQPPAQDPSDQKCEFPVYSGKKVDRKTRILDKPAPDFSSKDRREHGRQAVVLTTIFCGSGEVMQIKVKNSVSASIDAKAIEAARKIRFEPAEKDGNKVSQALIVEYLVQ